MKIPVFIAIVAAVMLDAAPADAASDKKHNKSVHRVDVRAVQHQSQPRSNSHDVYVGGEYIGRDPDPNIRAFMMRNPHIWDGPE
jgi:hypothetical protein